MSYREWLWLTWKRLRKATSCLLKTVGRRKEALWLNWVAWRTAWRTTGESEVSRWRQRKQRRSVPNGPMVPNGAKWTRSVGGMNAVWEPASAAVFELEDVCDFFTIFVFFFNACAAGERWTQVRNHRRLSDVRPSVFVCCWIPWAASLQQRLHRSREHCLYSDSRACMWVREWVILKRLSFPFATNWASAFNENEKSIQASLLFST